MTMEYDVNEAASWDDEKAANVIAYLKARPWLQADLDAVLEARGGEPMEGGDYSDMTKEELQDLLAERDLPVSGNKDELIARLQEADA